MINVYDLDSYITPSPHIIADIKEYDISKANINILLYKKIISKDLYDYLYSLPKIDREIKVGMMQRDNHDLSLALQDGFKEARHMLYQANNIQESDILAVKKDAVFLIDRTLEYTQFDNIVFKKKGEYNSYYRLSNLELYYNDSAEEIEIKGMSDYSKELHRPYIYDLLTFIFYQECHNMSIEDLLKNVQDLIERYVTWDFEVGYYREFNNRSLYRTNYSIGHKVYYVNTVDDRFKYKYINPIWNYMLFKELYTILLSKII